MPNGNLQVTVVLASCVYSRWRIQCPLQIELRGLLGHLQRRRTRRAGCRSPGVLPAAGRAVLGKRPPPLTCEPLRNVLEFSTCCQGQIALLWPPHKNKHTVGSEEGNVRLYLRLTCRQVSRCSLVGQCPAVVFSKQYALDGQILTF